MPPPAADRDRSRRKRVPPWRVTAAACSCVTGRPTEPQSALGQTTGNWDWDRNMLLLHLAGFSRDKNMDFVTLLEALVA